MDSEYSNKSEEVSNEMKDNIKKYAFSNLNCSYPNDGKKLFQKNNGHESIADKIKDFGKKICGRRNYNVKSVNCLHLWEDC